MCRWWPQSDPVKWVSRLVRGSCQGGEGTSEDSSLIVLGISEQKLDMGNARSYSQRGRQARPSQQAKGCWVFPGSQRGCHRHHLHCAPSLDAGTEALSQPWRQSYRPTCPSRSDVTWWEFPYVLGWGQGDIVGSLSPLRPRLRELTL